MANTFKSFYEWCEEQNHMDYIDRWNYELNDIDPHNVPHQSNKKFYFNCLIHPNHKPELKRLDNIVHQPNSINCKQCESFGQFLSDNKILYLWDDKKNNIDPFNIPKQYNKKVWMKCDKTDYHESYQVTCAHFYCGTRCPYCSKKTGKLHINDSLGYIHPEIKSIWSDKNKKDIYQYALNSNKKVWWKCPNHKHDDFYKEIYVMTRDGFHCPKCSEEMKNSYLQEKVYNYFTEKQYTVLTERNCSILARSPQNNRPLPYDNEIVELKLICEVHGLQHYWSNCSWYTHLAKRNNITPEEEFKIRQEYDEYKQLYAVSNGYHYLVIPYYTEKNDQYKTLIDNKINEILNIK